MAPAPPSGAGRAWKFLRAPLVGVVLGLLAVKGFDRWRIARLPPEERRSTAHAHCQRAQEISDEACRRLNVSPIYLPKDVMADMIDEYSRALEIDPGHLEALDSRAYWRWFRGDKDKALADYDESLRREPGNALVWYQRGRLRCERGDHKGAIEDFTRSLQVEPHHPGNATLGARAYCRREIGDWKGALEDLQAEGGYDFLNIADCHQAMGHHPEALPAYDSYLRKSDWGEARYRRGVSRFAVGDRAGALEDLTRACQPEGKPRSDAEAFIRQHPGDPMSPLLQEALRPLPEAPK